MNKLIFNNKEYELIECNHPKFIIFGPKNSYEDIGTPLQYLNATTKYDIIYLHIKDKFYELKLIENGK